MVTLYNWLIVILEIVTMVLLYNLIYITISHVRDIKFRKKVENGLNRLNSSDLRKDIQYVSKKKRSRYLQDLSLLIQQSGLNIKYKFITPVFIIVISCAISIIFFILSQKFINILVPSIFMALIGYKVPSVLLNILVGINSNKITKRIIDFINLLKNFCMVKNNISYAIASTGKYMKEPLQSICESFKYEVKHGIPPYTALENIKYRVDSNQYSLLIKNLQICSKHSNQYLEVLKKSEKLMMSFAKEQTLRKKEISRGVIGVAALVGMSALIFLMLIYMNPGLIEQLQTSTIGQIIVSINVFAYLVGILVVEKLARFDF